MLTNLHHLHHLDKNYQFHHFLLRHNQYLLFRQYGGFVLLVLLVQQLWFETLNLS
jgi:hypothetical protein